MQETVWLGEIPVATLRPGTPVGTFYVHTDHLNTPRKVSRPSDNQLRWQWEPDPFGTALPNENPQALGAFKYNLRFPGQLYDTHAGLSYNYFRDYDPAIGRYVESDPIGLGGGINTYLYAKADPVRMTDPKGENPYAAVRGAWWVGTRIGGGINYGIQAATGASLGSLIYDMCTESEQEREERCQENLDRDMATCRKGSRRYGSDWFRVCEQQAMARYSNCLSGRDEGIDAPLPPWGKL